MRGPATNLPWNRARRCVPPPEVSPRQLGLERAAIGAFVAGGGVMCCLVDPRCLCSICSQMTEGTMATELSQRRGVSRYSMVNQAKE